MDAFFTFYSSYDFTFNILVDATDGKQVRAFYKWGKWEFHIEILLSVLEWCEGIQDVSFGNIKHCIGYILSILAGINRL